jgi:hypothetical protein
MRRATKRILGMGALAAAGYAIWRAFDARKVDTGVTWQPQPFPYPPEPHTTGSEPAATPEPATGVTAWVDPDPDGGACPASHPVKAKLASGIFHVPGGANYERTNADRCYSSADAAEADGMRASKV